ncbi:hypothetical protein DL98DRAFT_589190 [Cadophora sp. DSE1049]|nr:hypothetical protein DL98DRAFT_589190 [Cadophora sp. DSE1049]
MAPKPSVNMDATLANLLENGKYYDLLIRCHHETFKVHRAVVCSASDVIAAAVDRWQKEDANIAEFDMSSDELPVVRAFIDFLYKSSYTHGDRVQIDDLQPEKELVSDDSHEEPSMRLPVPGPWSEPVSARFPPGLEEDSEDDAAKPLVTHRAEELPFHVKMYIAGDLYNVQVLKDYALESFKGAAKGIEGLLIEHAAEFAKSIELCWEGTNEFDTKLRDFMTEFVFGKFDLAMSSEVLKKILPPEGNFHDCLLQAANRLYQKGQRQIELEREWSGSDYQSCTDQMLLLL